jgi:hypothetical protein
MVSGSLAQHLRNHGRFDGPGANRVDANASGGIFERSTLRQPEYSVFGCMIRCSARCSSPAFVCHLVGPDSKS